MKQQTRAHKVGCVSKLTPPATGGYTEKVIYSFGRTSRDGKHPFAGVTLDQAGNLYGTTSEGGIINSSTCGPTCDTVYELIASSGYTEKQLWRFHATSDGAYPFGGVIFDSSGNLYGSTEDFGSKGAGTFNANGGTFCGPSGNLALDGADNLYGTTYCRGGSAGDVFKLTRQGRTPRCTTLAAVATGEIR